MNAFLEPGKWLSVVGLSVVSTLPAQTPTELIRLRLPHATTFRVEASATPIQAAGGPEDWVRAWAEDGSGDVVEFGSRVVLELEPGTPLSPLLAAHPLTASQQVETNVFILEAPGAVMAMREAARLAAWPGVIASYPILRRTVDLNGAYARKPAEPHFPPALGNTVGQWYLENRDPATGALLGVDLNVRAAWPITRGEGVTIAVADVGLELQHRDLSRRTEGAPHHDFNNGSAAAGPRGVTTLWAHATSCASLAAADGDNGIGMIGVAPRAKLASWVIYTNNAAGNPILLSDDKVMDMFQYASNIVSVQNHSWSHGPSSRIQAGLTTLENIGIERAVRLGRQGRGVIMVRASGNDRALAADANDDGYTADPRVITVGSVGRSGRSPSYSERGACVLVAAPSGDSGGNGLFAADLIGMNGANPFGFFPPFEYLSDYVFNSLGFSGTSASAALISGVAALVVSANTNLGYRDVQQILALSARHFDPLDPDLVSNGAGLVVSHNDGFGVPDAGQAVRLARSWTPRQPSILVTASADPVTLIPDDGLRLIVSDPEGLSNSIPCLPSTGPHADAPTVAVPLVAVGLATNTIPISLHGKAALIERGVNIGSEKIFRAAEAGASFAVIYNYAAVPGQSGCPGGDVLCQGVVAATDYVPIPAVVIGNSDGLALETLFARNPRAVARLQLNSLTTVLAVTNTVICEQVGIRVQTDHRLRGDLRITLVSPAGTRSVLQRFNSDTNAGPVDWTYYSTHHFFESSAGSWRVEISDEHSGSVGRLLGVSLQILGVPIVDTDADGLDDHWEMARLGTLAWGPKDDVDGDGYNNAREQAMGTDPNGPNEPLVADLSVWDSRLMRLSWPAEPGRTYEIQGGPDPTLLETLEGGWGGFPEAEWFTPYTDTDQGYFRLHRLDR